MLTQVFEIQLADEAQDRATSWRFCELYAELRTIDFRSVYMFERISGSSVAYRAGHDTGKLSSSYDHEANHCSPTVACR